MSEYKRRLNALVHDTRNPIIAIRMDLTAAMIGLNNEDTDTVVCALTRLEKHLERIEGALDRERAAWTITAEG